MRCSNARPRGCASRSCRRTSPDRLLPTRSAPHRRPTGRASLKPCRSSIARDCEIRTRRFPSTARRRMLARSRSARRHSRTDCPPAPCRHRRRSHRCEASCRTAHCDSASGSRDPPPLPPSPNPAYSSLSGPNTMLPPLWFVYGCAIVSRIDSLAGFSTPLALSKREMRDSSTEPLTVGFAVYEKVDAIVGRVIRIERHAQQTALARARRRGRADRRRCSRSPAPFEWPNVSTTPFCCRTYHFESSPGRLQEQHGLLEREARKHPRRAHRDAESGLRRRKAGGVGRAGSRARRWPRKEEAAAESLAPRIAASAAAGADGAGMRTAARRRRRYFVVPSRP